MDQVKFVDLDVWFRTGGVNWELCKLHQDVVAIQAGIGTWVNPLFQEQMQGAIENGIPWFSWWIPDVFDGNLAAQTRSYLAIPGVRNALACVDVEQPGGGTRCVNGPELLTILHTAEDVTGVQPLCYSNKKTITEDLKRPSWLPEYWWWLAQYLWRVLPGIYYPDYDTFLARYAGKLPPSAADLGLAMKTIGWQFSPKCDARRLCANERTQDPIWFKGITDCDCSVSTIAREQFMPMLLNQTPPPPPPAPAVATFEVIADVVNIRSGPGTTYAILGTLAKGAQGDVLETDGTNVWYKIGLERWIASDVSGKEYSKLIIK